QYEVVVLDAMTGEEVTSGNAPAGIFYWYRSKIVCLSQQENNSNGQLAIYDLHDLLNVDKNQSKRTKALSTDPKELVSKLKPCYTLKSTLSHETIINVIQNGKVLGVITQAGVLNLINIETLEPVVPPINVPKMTQKNTAGVGASRRSNTRVGTTDRCVNFTVEFDGDDMLIMFVSEIHFNQQQSTYVGGRRITQNRNQPQGVAMTAMVGRGAVMRYNYAGEAMWEKPVEITNWYYLKNMRDFPVMLFGAMIYEDRAGGRTNIYPAVWGLDKKTGNKRFSVSFEDKNQNRQYEHMLGFIVSANPKSDQMYFVSSNWTFVGEFTKEMAVEPSNESSNTENTDETGTGTETKDNNSQEKDVKAESDENGVDTNNVANNAVQQDKKVRPGALKRIFKATQNSIENEGLLLPGNGINPIPDLDIDLF
ncbi:MAG: hypothetical protein ACRC2T_04450, partial [Thermoguttaceae bacterium]